VAALALVTAGAFPARAGQPGDSPGVSAIQTIYVVSTSHWDYGFTDPPANLPALIRAHINDAVAKCQTDVRHRYTIESVWMFEDYMSVASQAEKDNLLTLIRAGRIALSSSYTGPHSGIMSPEELNRWIYRAKRARDTYNITTRTAHVDDNPGYTWALPDALAGAGVDRLVAGCNTAFASEFPLPRNESIFRWRGPGGGETLTWVSRDAYTEGFSTWQIDANAARLFYGADHPEWVGWSNQQIMAQGITAQLGVLDAAGYPYDAALAILAFDKMNYDASGQLLNDITTWNANHTSPHIVLATADEFFDHMVATYGLGAFPVRTGNWTQRWERGKAYGMICEARFREMRDLLPAAETFSSVASQFGASYPSATFDAGWRGLMRFDDHGAGLGGTQAGEMTLAECNATNLYWMQTSQARQNDARGAVATAQTSIGSRIATPAGASPDVVVFNGLSSARTDIATATIPSGGQPFALRDVSTNAPVPYRTRTDGSIEFVAENVPALGFRRYRALIGQTDTWPSTVTATSTTNTATVESQTYRVTISKTTGEVTSIVDKTAGNRELVNSGSAFKFNRTVKAKNLTDFLGGVPSTQTTATATVTTRSGPVSGSLTVSYALPGGGRQSSPMSRIDVTLYDKLKRIDIVDTFDRSRLTYTIAVSDHSDHFYAPMPFNVPTAQLRTFIDGNAPVPFEPPSATYLSGPTVTAVNNSDLPSRGLTLRDSAAAFEIQVVSPQVFWYVVGANLNSNTYAPTEATVFGECLVKQDRTQTDDPGQPEVDFVLEPLENNPSQNYSTYTAQFSLTSGAVRSDADAGAFGSAVTAPLRTTVIPGGQTGPITAASLSFFSVDAPNVEILAVKRAEFGDPADTIVRVRERNGVQTSSLLRSAFAIQSASECTLLEAPTASLPVPVPVVLGPHQTKTLRLRLGQFVQHGVDSAGIYVPAVGAWFLRNSNSSGDADVTVSFGPPNVTPLVGDWNGDGIDTIGVFDPVNSVFFLKNAAAPGAADLFVAFGPPNSGWIPITGDWNGDGIDTIGLYDPSSGAFFLRNTIAPGPADLVFTYGPPGMTPIVGDWNGDGVDTVGVYAAGTGAFFLKNANASGGADLVFNYGGGGAVPLAGDWNGDGIDTVGISTPATGTFFLRNTNSSGVADIVFSYGAGGATPVMGNWDGQ